MRGLADGIFWSGLFAFVSATQANTISGLTKREIKRLKKAAQKMPKGDYSVYLSKTDDYVGITKQIKIRSATHRRNGRIIKEIINNIDKNSARIIEQTVINHVGRAINNTGPLANIINSIALKNPLYQKVISFVW